MDKDNKEEVYFDKIINVFKNDAIMITIILLACIFCLFCAYYSKGYDIKIQQFYHEWIKDNCRDDKGELIYYRPSFLTVPSFRLEVFNATKNSD